MNKKKLGRSQHWPRVLSRRPRFPGTCGLGREGWPPPGWRVGQKTGGSRAVGEKWGSLRSPELLLGSPAPPAPEEGGPHLVILSFWVRPPYAVPSAPPPFISANTHRKRDASQPFRTDPAVPADTRRPHGRSAGPTPWLPGEACTCSVAPGKGGGLERERELRWASRAVSPGSLHALAVTLTSQSLAVLLGPRIPRLRTVSFVLLMD